jgi:Right handed beta helix region
MSRMSRKLLAVLLTALVGAVGLSLASPAGAAGTVVVGPGESIQAAIDAADAGTRIIVQPGTYAENVAITTDGIKLSGNGATIVPPVDPQPNACSFGDPAVDGICVAGEAEFPPDGPPVVTDPISNVTVSGFTVNGFEASGVVFFAAENPVVTNIQAHDNHEYGIARFVSTGGKILASRTSGSEEAGIYVGDSPDADVFVAGNETYDNDLFGFFIRDAGNGKIVGNQSHDNCVGAIVLNTGANLANGWEFTGNLIRNNSEFCPGNDEEGTPPLSGLGVAIVGGSANTLKGNIIVDNVPAEEVPFAGGVAVLDFGIPGANPPSDNVVKGNIILRNEPDLFYDGSGTGNVFASNLCETSIPDGLC